MKMSSDRQSQSRSPKILPPKQCFICTNQIPNPEEVDPFLSPGRGQSERWFPLGHIIDLPQLQDEVLVDLSEKLATQILYCDGCWDDVQKIQVILEQLERLEKDVLERKYEIEMKMRSSYQKYRQGQGQGDVEDVLDLRNQVSMDLNRSAMISMIDKIKDKRLGKTSTTATTTSKISKFPESRSTILNLGVPDGTPPRMLKDVSISRVTRPNGTEKFETVVEEADTEEYLDYKIEHGQEEEDMDDMGIPSTSSNCTNRIQSQLLDGHGHGQGISIPISQSLSQVQGQSCRPETSLLLNSQVEMTPLYGNTDPELPETDVTDFADHEESGEEEDNGMSMTYLPNYANSSNLEMSVKDEEPSWDPNSEDGEIDEGNGDGLDVPDFLIGEVVWPHVMTYAGGGPSTSTMPESTVIRPNNVNEYSQTHLRPRRAKRSRDTLTCESCEMDFPDLNTFEDHNKTYHSNPLITIPMPLPPPLTRGQPSKKPTPEPSRSSPRKSEYGRNRVGTSNPSERVKCEECGKSLASTICLRIHVNRFHRDHNEFRCPVCNIGCVSRSRLDLHMASHFEIRNFKCTLCTKRFKHKDALKQHIKTHSAEKSFHCNLCSSRFKYSRNLSAHMRMFH